jgi:hypothetical protein
LLPSPRRHASPCPRWRWLTIDSNRLRIENTITYLTPSFLAESEQERRKCSLLRSYDVDVRQVDVPPNDWPAFYDQALEHLRTSANP